MIDFSVKSNIDNFNKKLKEHERKQLPYAVSRALNDTLKDGRRAEVAHLRSRQKSSKPWWNNKQTGLNLIFSTKKHLVATIYTLIWWARLQEHGGVKTPKGAHILVPTDKTPKYGRKAGGHKKIIAGKKTLHHNGSPIITLKSGHKGVFRRRGKKRLPIDKMYTATPQARIDRPIIALKETMTGVVRKRFLGHAVRWINTALERTKKK